MESVSGSVDMSGRRRVSAFLPTGFEVQRRVGLVAEVADMLFRVLRERLAFSALHEYRAHPDTNSLRRLPHFERLAYCIEEMFVTGTPLYRVERTRLETGALDFPMDSLH